MRFDVTRELADRYGLDWEACQGVPFGEHPWQREQYVVRAAGRRPPEELRGVHVRQWHNFGNMVWQVTHALMFADRHGVDVVTGPENPWFDTGPARGVRLAFGRPPRRPALAGNFFYLQPLGLEGPGREPYLAALRDRFVLRDQADPSREDLVIHLRSGDVFGTSPHPAYWPPTLGYYLGAIALSGARSVRVVSQDWAHPFLVPLQRWCAEHGLTCEVQVSDLTRDLLALTSARVLCLSQGTMGLAAASLSYRAETVFVPFERDARELVGLGLDVHAEAVAEPPDRKPWVASESQVSSLLAVQDFAGFHRVG